VPLSGGIYLGKILGIIFTMANLFPSLDRLFEGSQDGSAQAVEGEAGNSFEDDSCTPIDTHRSNMTLSVIKSIRTSSTIFSAVLRLSDIQAWVS
jgi:hypothetical protein